MHHDMTKGVGDECLWTCLWLCKEFSCSMSVGLGLVKVQYWSKLVLELIDNSSAMVGIGIVGVGWHRYSLEQVWKLGLGWYKKSVMYERYQNYHYILCFRN